MKKVSFHGTRGCGFGSCGLERGIEVDKAKIKAYYPHLCERGVKLPWTCKFL